ncbi:mitochondrial fission process protein 1 [Apis laboriosa]|uniref:mitochondrial fission process protein 1 n=1 Tax=Apis dorsata TaxID=7462 RepID=UPI0003DF501E|nr:mitochondrial fission process protein 1 [Apis dorsata]XP_043798870.1 mitochondrial fission process protein 1 [Apis laboriosa]
MNEIKEINIYRDTPIRYLGYANEIGEAFRPIIPQSIVWFSYTVASGYVLADTINSGFNTYSNTVTTKSKNVLLSMTDTLLWQSFASVIIPGYTINRVCAAVQFIQKKSNNTHLKNRWIPTLIGLAAIPIIIHPIDNLVEEIMNITYRKWIRYYPK